MKSYCCLIFICVLITTSCDNSQQSPITASGPTFDMAGYEQQTLTDGVIRVFKRNKNGLIVEEGYIKDGLQTGVWTTYIEDRPESIVSYIDGKKYGKTFTFSHLLQIENEATFKNDILHGKKGRYKRGRPMEEGHYINNNAHGIYRLYFESGAEQGKIRQYTEYNHGKIHGKLKTYNAKGKITTEYDYKNGEKISGGIVK